MNQEKPSPTITFEQLADLRDKTERVAGYLLERLRTHLSAVSLVLAPKWTLGKYVGSREAAPRADEAYAQLLEQYKAACGKPFDLRGELDEEALSAMEHGIDVQPWEYTHDANGKSVLITNPFRWVVTYKSDYDLASMRNLFLSRGTPRTASVRHFVVNALAIQVVLARTPAVAQLLRDLGYEITAEAPPGLGKLAMLTVSTRLSSFRPADDLILAATRFSGVPAFFELMQMDALSKMDDPFRRKIEELAG